MLNKQQKLSKDVFKDEIEQVPTRNGYREGLYLAGQDNENVVALCADLTGSTRADKFAEHFSERFFQVGVAEQDMVGIAAGLGVSGKIPFISSYATFVPGRAWEPIRTTISYNDSNVKIAGHHAGISTGPDGATHQAVEDIATMRVMANMQVIVPADAVEAQKATLAAAHMWGPVYLRFARAGTPVFTTEKSPFTPGKAELLWETPPHGRGNRKPEAVIVACGPLVYEALKAAQELEEEGIFTLVLNSHTIKPLDEKTIVDTAKNAGAVVTVEEHQVAGGLGGAVAELLAREAPTPMEFVGLQGVYGESGQPEDLVKKYELDAPAIKRAVDRVIKKK